MKRGRTLLVIALIVALLATAVTQHVTLAQRRAALRTVAGGGESGSSLANMDSFALALLLGGMRGPLVMFLWMQSESAKQAKDLEGVETQIEWIRLLQPEFDTVHLFQIWNKAYNISVQMASLANKYSVILDALDYAREIERQRPDNINMLLQMANIYNDKLAGSAEKMYYRKRVREDSMYRPQQKLSRVAGVRPTRHDSLLDPQGNIRPELYAPKRVVKAEAGAEVYDGSDLQFLKDLGPFPYGVPAYGLAYNYYKRGQLLQRTTGQRHLQISDTVVDSRPALCLRTWSDEEWALAANAECRLLGLPEQIERFDSIGQAGRANPLELSAEKLSAHAADITEAKYRYSFAHRLMTMDEDEFNRHLKDPSNQMHLAMYASHLDHLAAAKTMISGDLAVLKALSANAPDRAQLITAARHYYQQSVRMFRIVRLRYYTDENLYAGLFPAGVTRETLEKASDAQLVQIIDKLDERIKAQGYDGHEDDAHEYMSYASKGLHRMQQLGK